MDSRVHDLGVRSAKNIYMSENQEIYYLTEYNWERGVLLSEGSKNYKIRTLEAGGLVSREIRVPKEKCAWPDEKICVVWETWRGTNGQGGYRVERVLHSDNRLPASQVARQSRGPGRVTEKEKHS